MQRRRASRDAATVFGAGDERTAFVQQQLELGKLVADSAQRARLAPNRAARELYIGPGGLAGNGMRGAPFGQEASGPPALPPLGIAGRGPPKRTGAGSELLELNRALKQRCDELAQQNAALISRFDSVEREMGELRQRAAAAEASERQLRSDMKHIVQRNDVLERMNDQLQAERQRAADEAEARSRERWMAAPPAAAAEESDASTAQASPLESERPPRPSTPQHTHTFLALVEKGLTRELERAAAAQEAGTEAPSPARTGHQISLRTQLRQLADMQKEVTQLQRYTEAVQNFSDKLTKQLRARERENAALSGKLGDQQREAEEALHKLNSQLVETHAQLAEAVRSAAQSEARATSAQGAVRSLEDDLARSETQLGAMRTHLEQMLTLHERLTEAALGLGASDEAIGSLIDELDKRLGNTLVAGIADQLDGLVASGGRATPRPPLPPASASPTPSPGAAASPLSLKRAVTKTRTNFMVARRYLLSTRQHATGVGAAAGEPSAASSTGHGTPPSRPDGEAAQALHASGVSPRPLGAPPSPAPPSARAGAGTHAAPAGLALSGVAAGVPHAPTPSLPVPPSAPRGLAMSPLGKRPGRAVLTVSTAAAPASPVARSPLAGSPTNEGAASVAVGSPLARVRSLRPAGGGIGSTRVSGPSGLGHAASRAAGADEQLRSRRPQAH